MLILFPLELTYYYTDVILCLTALHHIFHRFQVVYNESAELPALRSENVLICQRALRAYVLTSQCDLRSYVVTY